MFSDAFNRPRAVTPAVIAREQTVPGALFFRWLGTIIDFIILGILGTVLALIVGVVARLAGGVGATRLVGLVVLLVWFVEVLGYYLVLEGVWGRTLGKLATGLIVVDARGRPPGFLKAGLRTLLRLVEVNPFLIGGLPAAVAVMASSSRQRLGDMVAQTYVVPIKDLGRVAQSVEGVFE